MTKTWDGRTPYDAPHAQTEAQAADWSCSACGGPVKARNCGYVNFPEKGILWQVRCADKSCEGYKFDRLWKRV